MRKEDDSPITNAHTLVTLTKSGDAADLAALGTTTFNTNTNTITINPSTDLTDGTYTITLLANTVEDANGNVISSAQTASFTVDTTAPTVTFTPTNGTVTNDNATNITLQFNEPVQKEDGSDITDGNAHTLVTLKKSGDDADLAASGTTTFNTNTNTITITINPDNPLPDGTYIITLLANTVEDVYDHVVTDAQGATFTVDTLSPTVTVTPADKATVTTTTPTITITFTKPVKKGGGIDITNKNISRLVLILQNNHPINLSKSGAVTINNQKTVITIVPSAPLKDGFTYEIYVPENSFEDFYGNEVGLKTSTFIVDTTASTAPAAPLPDTTAPTVTFAPLDGTVTDDNATNITLQFNEPVRKADGNPITDGDIANIVTLKNSTSADIAFGGSISGNTITINPSTDLPDGTYIITLLAGTVEDVSGNVISDAQTASFTVDTTAPTVTFAPVDGTVTNNNATNITLQFNETVRKINDTPITSDNAHTLVTLTKSGDPANIATSANTTFRLKHHHHQSPPPTFPTVSTPSPFLLTPLKTRATTPSRFQKRRHSP